MSTKMGLSEFECGMVAGVRRSGLTASETADLLGVSHMTISRAEKEQICSAVLCVWCRSHRSEENDRLS